MSDEVSAGLVLGVNGSEDIWVPPVQRIVGRGSLVVSSLLVVALAGRMPVLAITPSKAPAVGAWSTTDSMSSSIASRFSSGGGAGLTFCRFPSSLVGVMRFLEKPGKKGLFSVTERFPERAVFQWFVLDMAEEQGCENEGGEKM